ncbi:MAG TPA: hypothetical protein VK436_07130 [Methanocella sp.]|nr:hypothetical protein [Methanocella sp.]
MAVKGAGQLIPKAEHRRCTPGDSRGHLGRQYQSPFALQHWDSVEPWLSLIPGDPAGRAGMRIIKTAQDGKAAFRTQRPPGIRSVWIATITGSEVPKSHITVPIIVAGAT